MSPGDRYFCLTRLYVRMDGLLLKSSWSFLVSARVCLAWATNDFSTPLTLSFEIFFEITFPIDAIKIELNTIQIFLKRILGIIL